MATFSDTFTQGGQTQLHKFHMIRQVIGSTLKGGFGSLCHYLWTFYLVVPLLARFLAACLLFQSLASCGIFIDASQGFF
jgi:hypothetical protein